MTYKNKLSILLITGILMGIKLFAQVESRSLRLGFIYEIGKQQIFPYNSRDYKYNINGFKTLINWPLKKSKFFSYELQFEPGLFFAQHQLLEALFIQPGDGPDYLEKRVRFMKETTIKEYVLNVGFQFRYTPVKRLSLLVLIATGPMFSDTETERLAKGFAFSDMAVVGCGFKTGRILFEIRTGVRHVSNADLHYPNSGHNSSIIDFGVSYALK